MTRVRLVLATSNRGKLLEFKDLLSDLPIDLVLASDVLDAMPVIEEDGDTFESNAVKKATGIGREVLGLTLADDSGLEVDALHGAPGIHSARWAGAFATDEQNRLALLRALEGVPMSQRKARFRCALCLFDPRDGMMMVAQGRCEGVIVEQPRGESGFGYDPLFEVEGRDRTMAQLGRQEKNKLSHRAKAVEALRPRLVELLARQGQRVDERL